MKAERHEISLEIAGPSAMWTRPDSGDCPVSYPVPTYSAVKGIFESILHIEAVEVVPIRVEVCAPVEFHTYNTNYGGPLRKSDQVRKQANYQLYASVLVNPAYRLHAVVRNAREKGKVSGRTQAWLRRTSSPTHAYRDIFFRRLKRGQSYVVPCLGWREFTPDYVGMFRDATKVRADIDMTLPSLMRQVFPEGLHSGVRYVYDQDVVVKSGVLSYPERDNA